MSPQAQTDRDSMLFEFGCGCYLLVWADNNELDNAAGVCSQHLNAQETPLTVHKISLHHGDDNLDLFMEQNNQGLEATPSN